jgi:hypothetical protein
MRDERTRYENAQPGRAAAPAWTAAQLPLLSGCSLVKLKIRRRLLRRKIKK